MRKLKPDIQLAAKELQLLVRAEAGACTKRQLCVQSGRPVKAVSPLGYCRCVTCGVLLAYKGSSWDGNHMQGGHYLRGRTGAKSVMLDERNVHPQCSGCNGRINSEDVQANYRIYMMDRYGESECQELLMRKNVCGPPSDDEIVRLREDFRKRIKIAEGKMEPK